MHVLVTGGAGFIGSHVADALLAAGHVVTVVDDLSTGKRENVPEGAEFVELDIRDAAGVMRAFERCRPQVVSHQAAQVSVSASTREPAHDAEINVIGTLNLLQAAVRTGLERFVFASTGGAIYGEVPEGQRAAVDWPPTPLSPYACSKLAVERYLAAYRAEHGLVSTVLRYANVYGPRQDPHGEAGVMAIFSRQLLAGEPIRINARAKPGDGGCVRDYVFVRDVVAANEDAVEGRIEEPIMNVASGVGTTTLELAHAMAQQLGVEPELVDAPRREGDLERSVLEPAPGRTAVPASEGLAATLDWFRNQP